MSTATETERENNDIGSTRWQRAMQNMTTYGGSFVRALADAWRRADSENNARLMGAFGHYYERYAGFDNAPPRSADAILVLTPPKLKIDDVLYPPGSGKQMIPRCRLERRIVWNLLAYLAERGFTPKRVESDDHVDTPTAKAAMEEIFNLDDCWVAFSNRAGEERRLYIVLGNDGYDLLSNWEIPDPDADGFGAALDAFNGEDYA